jgi:hypothetical protein
MADASMPNYGIAQGLADGLKAGLIGYQNMKNIQHQNQMQEIMAGVQQNPDTGNLELNPLHQQQQKAQGLLAQRQMDELDPESDVSKRLAAVRGTIVNTATPKISPDFLSGYSAADQKEAEGLLKPEISGQYGMLKTQANPFVAAKTRQIDEGVHQKAVDDVSDKNKQVAALQTTYQNLNNAIKNFKQGGATSQEFNELQQAVRSNAGVKGQGGVSERADTYLKSQGLKWQDLEQFWTGDPKSVMENNPKLAEVILNVANLELENKRSQAKGQLDKSAQKHAGFYEAPGHEAYAKDFTNTKNAELSQFDLDPSGNPIAPQGLLAQPPPAQDAAAKLARLQQLKAKAAGGQQ